MVDLSHSFMGNSNAFVMLQKKKRIGSGDEG